LSLIFWEVVKLLAVWHTNEAPNGVLRQMSCWQPIRRRPSKKWIHCNASLFRVQSVRDFYCAPWLWQHLAKRHRTMCL